MTRECLAHFPFLDGCLEWLGIAFAQDPARKERVEGSSMAITLIGQSPTATFLMSHFDAVLQVGLQLSGREISNSRSKAVAEDPPDHLESMNRDLSEVHSGSSLFVYSRKFDIATPP